MVDTVLFLVVVVVPSGGERGGTQRRVNNEVGRDERTDNSISKRTKKHIEMVHNPFYPNKSKRTTVGNIRLKKDSERKRSTNILRGYNTTHPYYYK